jgi:hypothetical protein
MGGAFTAVANDITSLYWNPSGTANIESNEAYFNHTSLYLDLRYDYAAIATNVGGFGTVGAFVSVLSTDDMPVRTVDQPEGTGEFFSYGAIVVGLNYSRFLTENFSIGFNAKYINESIWHMSASALAIDAGTVFRTDLFGGMTIGAVMSNFGTPMRLDGRDTRYFISVDPTKQGSNDRIPTNIELDSWDLPLYFQIGVSTTALQNDNYKFTISADALVPNNDYQSLNVGAEFSFMEYFSIRGGYNSLFLKDAEGGLSFGAGVNSKMLLSSALVRFDYAFRDFGKLNNVHSFSIGIKF